MPGSARHSVATAHTYDANGNLISDSVNTYIYDAENRLVTATAAGQTATLTYDPMGRLWQIGKGAANTRFLYDGDALVGEFDGSGAVTARYVHGSNADADDPLVWYQGSTLSSPRWLHADHQGSIVAATNAQGGSPSINAYDEYGIPAAGNVGRFQYTGQLWLSEIGLYHYKSRLYSPRLGRFLQVDPIGYEDQINLYVYVGNDPVNALDPTGEIGWIGAAIGGGLEVFDQVVSGEASNAISNVAANLRSGDFVGAARAAAPSVAKNSGGGGSRCSGRDGRKQS